jgi:hypothetical protein
VRGALSWPRAPVVGCAVAALRLRQKGSVVDDRTREALELRALDLWRDAGEPAGCGLHFWLMAELELAVVKRLHRHDPFLVLLRMAACASPEGTAQAQAETAVH